MSINLQTRLDERLWNSIENTYTSRNYTGAILDAMHFIGELIRSKSGLEADGVALVGAAFGGNSPVLKINRLQTETDVNIQRGVEQILRGLYQAVRNPRSHEKHNDIQDNADAIILFVNYIVTLVEQSKSPLDKATFQKRIFDPLFPDDRHYAELIAEEIPKKLRLDILIQTFRDRATGDPKKLSSFVAALLERLDDSDVDHFCATVSDEFRNEDDEVTLRTAIQLVPPRLWTRYSETARLRIEHRLIGSIRDGRYDSAKGRCVSGGFGSWASGMAEFLTLKDKLAMVIKAKLISEDTFARAYALNYFSKDIPVLQPTPKPWMVDALKGGLESGNDEFYTNLYWIKYATPEWSDALKDSYDKFESNSQSAGIFESDDDVPF